MRLLFALLLIANFAVAQTDTLYYPSTILQNSRNLRAGRGLQVNDTTLLRGVVKIPTGAGAGKVFTSAANGVGTWQTAAAGTVTSVAALTIGTTGTDITSSVANSTTTPVITLNVPTASATNRGALSSTDWATFNNKQATISVTTPITLTGASVGIVNQGTTTQVLHGNAAGNASFGSVVLTTDVSGVLPSANGGSIGYEKPFNAAAFSPADGSIHIFGAFFNIVPSVTTGGLRRLYYANTNAGTITAVYMYVNCGTPASNENVTFAVRLNNTTDYTITATGQLTSTSNLISGTGMSVPLVQGDYIEIKMINPSYSTNPLNVSICGSVYIQ